MTRRPRTGPTRQARSRRVLVGRTRARAMRRRPSSGTLANAPGVRRLSWSGATRAAHTTRRARIVSTTSRPARARPLSRHGLGNRRLWTLRDVPVDPQPPHVVAERRGQQGECGEDDALLERARQDVCSRDGQHDPLRRSDDPAPEARRQRPAHPGIHPPGCEEHVAHRSDREHPGAGGAGDIHAQDCDQERIDLTVPVGAPGRRRPGASHDPTVDRVQHERDDRQRHQQRDLRGPVERVCDQRRDTDGQRRPGERHPVGRAQPVGAVAGEAARQCRIRDHATGDSDNPTGAAEADGAREGDEQQRLGDHSHHRAGLRRLQCPCGFGLDRSHRSSVFVATSGSTESAAVRISEAGGKVRARIVNCGRVEQP